LQNKNSRLKNIGNFIFKSKNWMLDPGHSILDA
jgi:hypothetical protein